MNINPAEIRIMVRVVTQRTGAPIHDEDLEQDAVVRAMEASRKQCEIRHPRAFLMKIVCDAVRDHWRRRRSAEDIASVDESRFALRPRFEDDIDRSRQTELLRQALNQIEAGKRATLEMFYSEDLSVAEIAHIHNKSVSAVKMELMRARRLLAQIIRTLAIKKSR